MSFIKINFKYEAEKFDIELFRFLARAYRFCSFIRQTFIKKWRKEGIRKPKILNLPILKILGLFLSLIILIEFNNINF
ncbi:MAG: hypothetical protein ACPLKP_01805 [Microgenomates group bacterium]